MAYLSTRLRCWSVPVIVMMAAFRVPTTIAHPLGNFTVNHFSRLTVAKHNIAVNYVIDMAEIPAFSELRAADTNTDGTTSQAELNAYLARKAASLADGLVLTLDGKQTKLAVTSQQISPLPGAGGLRTLRLQYNLTAAYSDSDPEHHLQFEDTNFGNRIGWREIAVSPEPKMTVFNSSAFSNSISDELRQYPPEMLANPLNERTARLQWTAGPAPAGAILLRARNGRPVVASRDRFAELISVRQLTPVVALLGMLIAAVFGAAHALSPGHGKTVVGAYLVGSRGTPRHAFFLGLTVTATHTAGVFALGFVTLFASHYILPERLFPVLSFVSGALVVLIGGDLCIRRLGNAITALPDHSHTHSGGIEARSHGAYTHSHDGKFHTHIPPGTNGEAVTWRSLLALGISGGLLPCPSALVVLLSAIALHRVGYGLLLVLAFSVGLAGTLTSIGLAFVFAGRWLNRTGLLKKVEWLSRVMPVLSALVVVSLGMGICYEALRQIGIDPVMGLRTVLGNTRDILSGQRPLASMGALAVLLFGLILGFKHATEADHVVAVSSIVSEHRRLNQVALIGGLWGLGHTLTLVVVGFIVLIGKVVIPERISAYLELGVAAMIIALSGSALRRALTRRTDIHVHTHTHGLFEHSHLHFHEGDSEHVRLGKGHSHSITRIGIKPLLVGAMHGLAGSAAVTLLVLTQVHNVLLGLGYLLLFGIGSVFGMMGVSTLIGLPFAFGASRLTQMTQKLQVAAGLGGACFGLWYAYSVGSSVFGI